MNETAVINSVTRELWFTGQTCQLEQGLEDYLTKRCEEEGLAMPMVANRTVPPDTRPLPVMFIHRVPVYEFDFTLGAENQNHPDIRELIFLRGLRMASWKITETFERSQVPGYVMHDLPPAPPRQRAIELA